MPQMTRVYCQCNSGHIYVGAYCPFDGYGSPETEAVVAAARRLEVAGITPSIHALRGEGVSEKVLGQTIVIEFGSDESVFDAVAPKVLKVGGKILTL